VSIELSDVALQIDFSATGANEVIQNVKTIITTPAGTVPFDRDFGIDWSLLDLPIREARAKLTVEYIEKIKKYEPRASVNSISFTANEQGQLIPKVVIDIVGT
jgi:hypothetical protein